MTKPVDPDRAPFLPFSPGEMDRSGLRLTRAEFARFMDVSKQACGEWVASGKIQIGADGRLDPRQAVSQLLRNSDPARLRSKVLAPLVKDIGIFQNKIAEMEAAVVAANEEADFNEASAIELIEQQEALRKCLEYERSALVTLPSREVIAGLIAWLNAVTSGYGDWNNLSILDCIARSDTEVSDRALPGAPEVKKGEGG